ncbi:MAG: ribbon-helix-helix domain-containing protein [Rothia sp. (in: high G+C Gram-positive bacteria)]|nr:ribbon-helix-helix domain-containing protein [Rothia sp. (in: high G+C Gram-positive bacteria)]
MTTKISISLADETVAALDQFIAEQGIASRSAAIQQAIARLTAADLGAEYAQAWREWEESGEADTWDVAVGDGLR